MFRKPFADFNAKAFGMHHGLYVDWILTSSFACAVPLRATDWGKLQNTVTNDFSVTLEIVDLLVPEGLFSVRFETHSHVEGVSSYINPGGSIDPTTYLHP